ncbi:hypothetical protein D3C80_2154680 [compost metagenome]
MSDAVGMLGQGRQGLALARGAGNARIVEPGARGDRPEALLACFGQFALAQQHW